MYQMHVEVQMNPNIPFLLASQLSQLLEALSSVIFHLIVVILGPMNELCRLRCPLALHF